MRAKQAKPAFEENFESAAGLLELVHADLMGPFQVSCLGGLKYVLIVIDDYSRHAAAVCVSSKADVPEELLTRARNSRTKSSTDTTSGRA